jgi:hypothetical protein
VVATYNSFPVGLFAGNFSKANRAYLQKKCALLEPKKHGRGK